MIIAIFLFVAVASGTPVSRSRFSFFKERVAASKNPQVSVIVSKSRGLGFLASRDLSPGELFLSTPAGNSIVCQDAFPFSMAFSRHECHYRLMARAMYDRWVNPNPGMPADYSRHMVDVDDIVYFWDNQSKDYLLSAVPGALDASEFNYDEMKTKFLTTLKAFPGIEEICPECITEAAFNWAFWLLITHVRESRHDDPVQTDPEIRDPDEHICAFYPLLDIYNHLPMKRGQKVTARLQGDILNTGTQDLEVYTDRFVKKGHEVFISYAQDSSLAFFNRFGILVHKNPDEYLTLNFIGPKACIGTYSPKTNLCKVLLRLGPVEKRLLLSLRLEFMSEFDLLTHNFSPIDTSLEQYYRSIPAAQNATEDDPVTKEIMLKASLRYRGVILEKGFPRCVKSYRETVRAINNEDSHARKRQVDELCQIVWETQFAVMKPIERYLMFILQFDLRLKQDLELK